MADINSTDELLVNRSDTTYTEQQGTIMANLQDDDYLLLNREDTTYKITGKEFIESVVDPLEVSAVLDDPIVRLPNLAAFHVVVYPFLPSLAQGG